MITVPYSYRNSKYSTPAKSLPTPLCGANRAIWLSSSKDVFSGRTLSSLTPSISPCLSCVTFWGDQSPSTINDATLLYSARATGTTYPEYNPDYYNGGLSTSGQSFISFDNKTAGDNTANFLTVPYNNSFSKLKEFTYSIIFRCRRINPNVVTIPYEGSSGSLSSLIENNGTSTPRSEGWGVDATINGSTGIDELRIWYYDNAVDCYGTTGNQVLIPISDWTNWCRLTVRISGNTIQANIYNNCQFSNNQNVWINGTCNGKGKGVTYNTQKPQLFLASLLGTNYPTSSGDQSILNGSWDILDFTLYDKWMSDSCVQDIWDYYDYKYGNLGCAGNSTNTVSVRGNYNGTSSLLPIKIGSVTYWSGSIYLQSEINTGGNINELYYYMNNLPNASINTAVNIKIYMGHTTISSFSSTTTENLSSLCTDWSLVRDNAISFIMPGMIKIYLNKSFNYNNVNNLLIKIEYREGQTTTSPLIPSFRYFTTSGNTSIYNSSPSSIYPPTGSPVLSKNRPNVILGFA